MALRYFIGAFPTGDLLVVLKIGLSTFRRIPFSQGTEARMNTRPLLLERLVSGFFGIACLNARSGDFSRTALSARNILRLTDRLDRLRRTRWQWCSMVLLLVLVRLQSGFPLTVELTALVQFVIFLSLPVAKRTPAAVVSSDRSLRNRSGRRAHSASRSDFAHDDGPTSGTGLQLHRSFSLTFEPHHLRFERPQLYSFTS